MTGKPLYIMIARDVSTDETDHMNSITKIIDKFGVGYSSKALKDAGLKKGDVFVSPVSYVIASSWLLSHEVQEGSSVGLAIEIIDPKGATIMSESQTHESPSVTKRLTLNLKMPGLFVTRSGEYKLKARLEIEGAKVAEGVYPYEVDLHDEAAQS